MVEPTAIMLASVLSTPRAVEMSVFVVRAFVALREALTTHHELAQKLAALERRIGDHDTHIRSLVEAMRQLMAPPEAPRRRIGFHPQTAWRRGAPIGAPR